MMLLYQLTKNDQVGLVCLCETMTTSCRYLKNQLLKDIGKVTLARGVIIISGTSL